MKKLKYEPTDLKNPESNQPEVKKKDLTDFIEDCYNSGVAYRDKFKPIWDEVEMQIRLQPPASWKNKEDWQTKIVAPLQCKGSKTGFTMVKKMLFSGRRLVDIAGIEESDKARMEKVMALMDALLTESFEKENNEVIQESVDDGSSFMKVLASPKKDRIQFTQRSIYNCVFDPTCGSDFYKSMWWAEEDPIDISKVIQNQSYGKKVIEKMLADAKNDAEVNERKSSEKEKALATIKSIDGTEDIQIPAAYKIVRVIEWWGQMKVPKEKTTGKGKSVEFKQTSNYTTEWRVITLGIIGKRKYILRNDKDEYGVIPVAMAKLNPRKHDTYGKGFLDDGRSLQELATAMICLGFDSAKLSVILGTIFAVDTNACSDWSSVQIKMKAIWEMKDLKGFDRPPPISSAGLPDTLKGYGMIDQMHQDATSLTRHSQGGAMLPGQTEGETLGEYQLKMQAISDEFLVQAKILEACYCKPLFRMIYKIITNPKLFTQEACDRILGMDVSTEKKVMTDPASGQEIPMEREVRTSRLLLTDLDPDMELDFKLVGITQLQEILQIKEQLTNLLQIIASFPPFMQYIKPYGLLKGLVQSMRIADPKDVVKTDEEVAQELQQQSMIPQLQQIIQLLATQLQGAGIEIPPQIQQVLMAMQQQQPQEEVK